MIKFLAAAIWMLFSCLASAQNIGAKFVFGTYHPTGNSQARFMPYKTDERATFVFNWGTIISYQKYLYKKRLSIKFAQGAYSDCARLFAGHTHIGLRINFLNGRRHSLELGVGPTYVYRQSWYRFAGYEQEVGYLKPKGDWQTAFVWYGGEIDYNYHLNDKWNISLNVIPGPPYFMTFGIGARYWFNTLAANKDEYWRHHPKIHILH